ncbi:DUF4333 domain-containing protein [Saccharomonospora sp. NPDC046836]|uniref:DUF4333 domain-containing protein n=1 Tax=Saccharomonospora sp. NPDC046836 TaxID=3156921 RepID=UPI003409124E
MTQPPGQPQGWWQPPQQGQHYPAPGQQPPNYQAPGQQPAHPQAPRQPAGFGGTFQSQYGGLGAFGDVAPPKRRKLGKPLLIGAIVVVLLAGGGIAAWLLGAFRGDVLEQRSLQTGVATVLRDSYGEHDVTNVQCPADQQVQTGHTFECTVEIGGQRRAVSIRVLNDKPEFEVGAPK